MEELVFVCIRLRRPVFDITETIETDVTLSCIRTSFIYPLQEKTNVKKKPRRGERIISQMLKNEN